MKKIILFTSLTLISAIAIYAYQFNGKFMVEFGDSTEARNEFIELLDKNNISHKIELDHIGRVWVVPDQSKRHEYNVVMDIWQQQKLN